MLYDTGMLLLLLLSSLVLLDAGYGWLLTANERADNWQALAGNYYTHLLLTYSDLEASIIVSVDLWKIGNCFMCQV